MIGLLNGTVRHGCVLTASGVGYRIEATCDLVEDETVELLVETVQGPSDTRLFGFRDRDERDSFVALCKLPGVGPAAALSVLRTLGVGGLCTAVSARDESALKKARGVGARAASTIATNFDPAPFAHVTTQVQAPADPLDDLVTTLTELGFAETEARVALDGLAGNDADVLAAAIERLSADRVGVAR